MLNSLAIMEKKNNNKKTKKKRVAANNVQTVLFPFVIDAAHFINFFIVLLIFQDL